MLPTPLHPRTSRRFGSLGIELLLILPVLLIILAAVIEFGLLIAGEQRLGDAAGRGARFAARGGDEAATRQLIKEQILGGRLGQDVDVHISRTTSDAGHTYTPGQSAQVFVNVTVIAPATAVAPDLLSFIGIKLSDEKAIGHATMMVE